MSNQPDPAPSSAEIPVASIEHDNSQIEEFIEQNRNKLILAALVIVVGVIAYVGFKYTKESGFSEAAGALTGAETIEELREVVSNYPNDVVAGTAELLIIDKLQEEDKLDEAHTALKQFVSTYTEHPLHLKAVSDLGLLEHMKGDLGEAVNQLRQASAEGAAPEFISHPAQLRLGDAIIAQGLEAMANDDVTTAESFFEEARTVFEDLEARAGEQSELTRLAKDRRERLSHLSIRPLSAEQAKAQAAATPSETPAEVPTLSAPPIEAEIGAAVDEEAAEAEAPATVDGLPTIDLSPPAEAALPETSEGDGSEN